MEITKVFILHFICIMLLGTVTPGQVLVRNYTFVVRNTPYTRLCNNKTIMTINGLFPGPTIYARRGDLVFVNVHNHAGHNITIHWHGVKMPRYPWSDGPEYVAQCPIAPNTSFRQQVVLSDEEGTLWWHAHSEWSRATVYGAIVVLPQRTRPYPFPKPHAEVPILLGEWWHADVQAVMQEFLANGGDPNTSDAFLINGQPGDLYPCSRQDTFKMTVEFGKTYLLRVVNAVMNNIMFFKIANHNVTIVGSDASYTKQFNSDYIAISPGQTIDLLLEANQPPGRYYMAARVYASGGNFDNTTTTGIIEYIGNNTLPSTPLLPTLPAINNTLASFNFTRKLRSLADETFPVDVPLNIDTTLFFTLSINLRPCVGNSCQGPFQERFLASMNNITLQLPTIAILQAYYNNISGVYGPSFPDNPPFPFNYTAQFVPRDLWRPENGTRVRVLEYNSTVEIVFQGTNMVAGIDHPMHLHGHSFYVVGSGLGNFNKDEDPKNYNLNDPPLMETIAVPVNGWTAIRFKANNPGVWFMHCHFERHVSWGMGMAFIVKNGKGPNARMLPPPPDMPRC
ncbi:Multicopper oxidase [Handroanthus impetiginosus]|uniref:Laccase n=1 Tax=Handroanthus impetiginosus TaxID=429701 RepID=A0A2G9G416_9LAMI|nr:Multicopper oxidase [Handroanthus impetiginosus]